MPYTLKEKNGATVITSESRKSEELFVDAARALFGLLYESEHIREDERIKIVVDAPSLSALLHAWLNELIERKDIHGLVFRDFSIASIQKVNDSQYLLTGAAYGETYDAIKHICKKQHATIDADNCVCDQKENSASCSFEVHTS